MGEIHIEKVGQVPFDGFSDLLCESLEEGYNFLGRLAGEWKSEKNRFSQQGEGLYKILNGVQVIGIGGINRDPFSDDNLVGRIRRFYIKRTFRGQGVGSILLEHILNSHWESFEAIGLRTDSEMAGRFYEKYGFGVTENNPRLSHKKWRKPNLFEN